MGVSNGLETRDLPVSEMAENLVGSEIIRLAGNIRKKVAAGAQIHNLTIGDFNPMIFPIPAALKAEIIAAYQADATNYPAANGLPELRSAISDYIAREQGLHYTPEEFLVAGGARPLIFAAYTALVDPGETVVFPVPSWNNNHYTHLMRGGARIVEATVDTNFMPSAASLRPHLKDARLVALCSPLNPTGTAFTREQLLDIVDAVLEENARRSPLEKPLYLLYDQIYWQLTYGETAHVDPVSLNPAMRPFTVFVDGISKCFAATGVRVGWSFGPEKIIGKMRAILGHVGAWAPRAEQLATAAFLANQTATSAYLTDIRSELETRLRGLHAGFEALRADGHAVYAVAPQAAIYLTVKFDLAGKRTAAGHVLETTEDITAYLLDEAGLAIVPFYAFGTDRSSRWYRFSVGTLRTEDIGNLLDRLRVGLEALS